MKGSFFLGADRNTKFEVRDLPDQQLGAHDVFVEVHACGVCGTDVHIYHGEAGSAEVSPPVVLGHEFAGIVKAVGSDVTTVRIGDHVAMDPNMYCGECMPCRMGKKQNCEHLEALGVTTNGGFAEGCICPESQCFVIDPNLSFDEAAMVEPLACVIHGIDNAHIIPGQNVLVIGGGPIGLLMVQMSRLSGASAILLSEPVEMRRKLGLELGADHAIDPLNEDLNAKIQEYTGREGVDVVIECVGKPSAVSQAIQAAGFSGTILLFSVPSPDATVPMPLFDIYKKELHIVGSMINPDTHQRAVNLLNSGRLEIRKLITHTYGLEHLEDAIKMQMSSESIKVIVHPQE